MKVENGNVSYEVELTTPACPVKEQLKTELLIAASAEANYPMEIRIQPDYDHSYFFMATFMEDHIHFHARHLG